MLSIWFECLSLIPRIQNFFTVSEFFSLIVICYANVRLILRFFEKSSEFN